MVVVDKTNACLIRDIKTGSQRLVTDPQMFVPSHIEEILETRSLVVLKEYEVMVLVDPNGIFVFKHGWLKDEASFFVPPFHTTLVLKWSKSSIRKPLAEGSKLESILDEEDLDRIDVRHQFMPYAFVARTHDNVEIILDIVFGWQVTLQIR